MSNTNQPADLESIFKFECIPYSTYELFKTVVTVGMCTGVEALTLFHAALIPSLIFRREEGNKIIEKRIFKDPYGNIFAIPEGNHDDPHENGYELLQQYLYENCFTYSFYAPEGAKVNEAVFFPSEQTNCWALVTGTWKRDLDTGFPVTDACEKPTEDSVECSPQLLEVVRTAAEKIVHDMLQEYKKEEKEAPSGLSLNLVPLEYSLGFKGAMTKLCNEQGNLVMVSKETGFAYGFDGRSQLYTISSQGNVFDTNEMGIEETEIANLWTVLPYPTFMVYACTGKIKADKDS